MKDSNGTTALNIDGLDSANKKSTEFNLRGAASVLRTTIKEPAVQQSYGKKSRYL